MASELAPYVMGGPITGTVDPTGGKDYFIGKVPAACRGHILKAYMITATAKALHADNNVTVTLYRVRDAVATSIGSATTDDDVATAVAITADTPWEISLTSDALSELAAGDVLQAHVAEGAVGQDLTEVSFFVEWCPGTGEGM